MEMEKLARFFVLCSGFAAMGAAQDYRVIYTGRMMGEFRMPDRQTVTALRCGEGTPSAGVAEFLKMASEQRAVSHNTVMVAMGDNFAPDLLGRQMEDSNGRLQPKEHFDWDYLSQHWLPYTATYPAPLLQGLTAGMGFVPFDNVGCFIQQAGFDALVPGKHDFYFGPERLRQLARYLANPAPGLKTVQMLAANLTVATTPADTPDCPPVNDGKDHGYRVQDGEIKFGLPKIVLPYMREVELQNAVRVLIDNVPAAPQEAREMRLYSDRTTRAPERTPDSYQFAFLCDAPDGTFDVARDASHCISLARAAADRQPATATSLLFSLGSTELRSGNSYFVCASVQSLLTPTSGKSGKPVCAGFTVHYPFFEYGGTAASGANPRYANPKPWALVSVGSENVAVFGVVDTDFKEHVGKLNYSWRNTNTSWSTELEVSDPGAALLQVLQKCNQNPQCRVARKILLAQMVFGRAAQLGVHLGEQFDLVIAQTDGNHAPGNEEVLRTPGRQQPFLLVPAAARSDASPTSFRVRLQHADVMIDRVNRRLVNRERSVSLPAPAPGGGTTLRMRIEASPFLSRLGATPGTLAASELLEDVALVAMRDTCKADIALLQHRDVYRPPRTMLEPGDNARLQQALDLAFWKGDLITCTRITGSTLTDVMAQSEKFDTADRDDLSTELEKNRGLAVLGTTKDDKQWVVAGTPVDPGKLYSLAIPDYLSNGDTGYPVLAKPAVPPPDRLPKTLHELAASICRAIDPHAGCRDPIARDDYFDPISLAPYGASPAPQATAWLGFWKAHNLEIHNYTKGAKTSEVLAEQKRQLSFTLDKLDAGYSLHLHSNSEQDLKNNVAGVPYSAITAAEERDFTGDYGYRLVLAGRRTEWFASGQALYADKATRTTFTHTDAAGHKTYDSPYIFNQLNNSLMQDEGFNWRVFPNRKNLSFIRITATTHLETQLLRPNVQLQLVDPQNPQSPPAPSLPDRIRSIPRTYYLVERIGPRVQTEKSWFEIGVQRGMQFEKPVKYIFSAPGTPISSGASCDLSVVGASVQSCITNAAKLAPPMYVAPNWLLTVQGVNRPRSGAYINFRLKLPVPRCCNGLGVTFDNQGEWFAPSHSDTVLDTRYFDDLTTTLNVPVWGNFSLTPKVDTYFYRSAAGYYVRAFSTSVTLKYHFDWHEGVGWWKAMKYPNPATAQ